MLRYYRLNESQATDFLQTSNTNFLNAYSNSQAAEFLSSRFSNSLVYGNHFDTVRKAFLEVFYTLQELDIDVQKAGDWKEYTSGFGGDCFFEFDSNIYLAGTTDDEMDRALELLQDKWKNMGLATTLDRGEQFLEATIRKIKVTFRATCGYCGGNRMCISLEILAKA